MKICHYLASINMDSGGPPRSVSFICKELSEIGIDVTVLTSQHSFENDITLSPLIKRHNIISPNEFKPFLETHKFDVIHLHGIWLLNTHHLSCAAQKLNVPIIVSPRGMLEPWAIRHKHFKKFLAWHLYQKTDLKKATAFHATANSELSSIKKFGFKQPVYSIPNGVYPAEPDLDYQNSIKEKNILFLSRINKKKGLDILLEAWAKVETKEWILQIAGNDDDGTLKYIEKRIEEKDLRLKVKLLGSLNEEEKKLAYQQASVFVLPSHSENFGIVVAEALSFGIPVITTKGCPWEDLIEYECGWWIDLSEANLIDALKTSMQISCDQRRKISLNAKRLIQDKYCWDQIAESFKKMYKEIVG